MPIRLAFAAQRSKPLAAGCCFTTAFGKRLPGHFIGWDWPFSISTALRSACCEATPGYLDRKLNMREIGDVHDVVFPCGYTMAEDGDTIRVYYGAADSCIALAQTSVRALLSWLDENGRVERRQESRG